MTMTLRHLDRMQGIIERSLISQAHGTEGRQQSLLLLRAVEQRAKRLR
jgi:hypothetical protein